MKIYKLIELLKSQLKNERINSTKLCVAEFRLKKSSFVILAFSLILV